MTTDRIAYDTYQSMTVTNLASLASDATDVYAGWQSARVSNLGTLAIDYEIVADIPMVSTVAANDSAAYMYVVPWVTTDGGTTWLPGGNFGTQTAPAGTESTANMSDPNSMKGPIPIPYKVSSQRLQSWFTIGSVCSGVVPDGWSLAFRNASGAAVSSSGITLAYRAITYTNS